MGVTCSKWPSAAVVGDPEAAGMRPTAVASASPSHGKRRPDCIDPFMHDLMKRSIAYSTGAVSPAAACTNAAPSSSTATATHGNSSSHVNAGKSRSASGRRTDDENVSPNDLPAGQLHLLFKRSKPCASTATPSNSSASASASASNGPASASQKRSLSFGAAAATMAVPTKSSAAHSYYSPSTLVHYPTRLVIRRRHVRALEEGSSGTHIYAIRFPIDQPLKREMLPPAQEQHPGRGHPSHSTTIMAAAHGQHQQQHQQQQTSGVVVTTNHRIIKPKKVDGKAMAAREVSVDQLFTREAMMEAPKFRVTEWVTVSAEHHVYVVDTGLSALDCDDLIEITEQACRGQYAAYTYAKQTLGCREFPTLARAARDVVHSVVYSIYERFAADNASRFILDDREPHMVKYDVTKKERQKLDMHTDKSEFTFLIALSNGCGLDYDGGGTYFECLDATIHVQRGQAIVFPGKLRHCGQRITTGVRFLLVGFLVDKTAAAAAAAAAAASAAAAAKGAGQTSGMNPDDNLDPALLPHIGNIP